MRNCEAGKGLGRIGPKEDKDLTNAEKIIFLCVEKKRTISTAESMTAGGVGVGLTRVPGASRVYVGGVITYTRALKQMLLGIPDSICERGMVTAEITLEMAKRVREKFNTYYGVAVTGNAGPTSDAGSASVGRVYFAAVDVTGREAIQECDYFGSRDMVRAKAVTDCLRFLRNFVEKE